jgi:hypothetical protein
MRIELPSLKADGEHNWVDIRDRLMSLDRFAVQEVASIDVTGEGKSKANFYAMANDMRNALLGRIITAWSFPVPIPSQNHFQAADVVIGSALDLDDYAAVEKAVEPLMDKISGRDLPDPKKPSGD